MRAAVYRRFGDPTVVKVEEIETPTPGAGEVLVRVAASVVSTSDVAMRSGKPFAARLFAGPFRPRLRILGTEFTGTVAAIGDGVDTLRVGDLVWGVTGTGMRAHAEYVVVPADGIIEALPAGLDPVDAAALIDPTALSFLDDTAELTGGQSILINGASGAVGSAAVQLAVHRGATVTAVCSAERAPLVRELGAHEVLDYRAGDVVTTMRGQGRTFDVVFDVFGDLGYRRARGILTPTGRYCGTVPTLAILWHTLRTRRSSGQRGVIAFTGLRGKDAVHSDLRETAVLAKSGVLRPVVDTRYPLDRVAEAHAHVERGKSGHIVLTMEWATMDAAAAHSAASILRSVDP